MREVPIEDEQDEHQDISGREPGVCDNVAVDHDAIPFAVTRRHKDCTRLQ